MSFPAKIVWDWKNGRQGTGYQTLAFIRKWFFDVVLIKYPPESYILWHTDKVHGKKHHRINLVLREAAEGGAFEKDDNRGWRRSRFIYFRPDVEWHRVQTVQRGTRLVLSIGWVTK